MRFTKDVRSSTVNKLKSSSRTELKSLSSTPSTSHSTPCYSPSEKILKIIMPKDLGDGSEVPPSFSPPPSNRLPMKKISNEYREVSCNKTITNTRNSVRFHSKVLVMRIPHRNQYPKPMKQNLWCSLSEIARSAQRNTIEFSAEGWDWRSAVEEESMYIHPKTGQYIHPVHVQRAVLSKSTTSPDVDKDQASARVGKDSESPADNYNTTTIAHAQPAHE